MTVNGLREKINAELSVLILDLILYFGDKIWIHNHFLCIYFYISILTSF